MSICWKGFIIAQNGVSCTILSEMDNLTYEFSLVNGALPDGPTLIRHEHLLDIFPIAITGKKMITACKNWIYDYKRSKKNYVKKVKTAPSTPTTL